MIKRTTKDVYIEVFSSGDSLEFYVTFHDNYKKKFSFEGYEIRELRCSERDFIEAKIRDYYEQLGEPCENLRLHFY